MEPSLQIVSESKEAEEDKSWWKLIFLALLGAGANWGAFYYFARFMAGLTAPSFWLFVALFVLSLIFVVLETFFIKSFWRLFVTVAVGTFAPLLVFYHEFGNANQNFMRILILGFIVGFYFVFSGIRRGHRMLGNSLKVRFFEVSRRILPRAASGFLIALAVVFYLSYFSWNLAPRNAGEILVDGMIRSAEPVAGIVVPGLAMSGDEKMGDFLKSVAESEAQKVKINVTDQNQDIIGETFNSLPPDYQAQVVSQITDQLEAGLKSKFAAFDPNQTVSEFAYMAASQYFLKFEFWLGPYAPIILAAILFFVAKGAMALFYWLIELMAFLLLKIFIVFGFAYTTLETKTREFLLLS